MSQRKTETGSSLTTMPVASKGRRRLARILVHTKSVVCGGRDHSKQLTVPRPGSLFYFPTTAIQQLIRSVFHTAARKCLVDVKLHIVVSLLD